jgi:hypothetical protein
MPEFDHNGAYLISAFGITVAMLTLYALYLRSRLVGARRRSAALRQGDRSSYSGRNVTAAAPIVTTAQPASSANGPRTP